MSFASRLGAALLLFVLAGPAWAADAEVGYLKDLPDVPLAPGLTEAAGQSLVYDKPEGRIIEAYATGAATPEEVRAFYADTLPQLGWSRAGDDAFRREGERLQIRIVGSKPPLTVRFFVTPN